MFLWMKPPPSPCSNPPTSPPMVPPVVRPPLCVPCRLPLLCLLLLESSESTWHTPSLLVPLYVPHPHTLIPAVCSIPAPPLPPPICCRCFGYHPPLGLGIHTPDLLLPIPSPTSLWLRLVPWQELVHAPPDASAAATPTPYLAPWHWLKVPVHPLPHPLCTLWSSCLLFALAPGSPAHSWDLCLMQGQLSLVKEWEPDRQLGLELTRARMDKECAGHSEDPCLSGEWANLACCWGSQMILLTQNL